MHNMVPLNERTLKVVLQELISTQNSQNKCKATCENKKIIGFLKQAKWKDLIEVKRHHSKRGSYTETQKAEKKVYVLLIF